MSFFTVISDCTHVLLHVGSLHCKYKRNLNDSLCSPLHTCQRFRLSHPLLPCQTRSPSSQHVLSYSFLLNITLVLCTRHTHVYFASGTHQRTPYSSMVLVSTRRYPCVTSLYVCLISREPSRLCTRSLSLQQQTLGSNISIYHSRTTRTFASNCQA